MRERERAQNARRFTYRSECIGIANAQGGVVVKMWVALPFSCDSCAPVYIMYIGTRGWSKTGGYECICGFYGDGLYTGVLPFGSSIN